MSKRTKQPDQPDSVNIYKVCMPMYMVWPQTEVTLKVFFSEDGAKKFIEEYPNPFVKPFLKIKMETVTYTDTD